MKKTALRIWMENHPTWTTEQLVARFKCKKQQVYQIRNAINNEPTKVKGSFDGRVKDQGPIDRKPIVDQILDLTIGIPVDGVRIKLMHNKRLIGTVHLTTEGVIFTKANKKLKPTKPVLYSFLSLMHGAQG